MVSLIFFIWTLCSKVYATTSDESSVTCTQLYKVNPSASSDFSDTSDQEDLEAPSSRREKLEDKYIYREFFGERMDFLDLHGVSHASHGKTEFLKFIEKSPLNNVKEVTVVTGRGAHSLNGEGF